MVTTAALESTVDGILIVDVHGKIVRWNRNFIDLWNVPEELLNTEIKDPVLGYVASRMAHPEKFLARVKLLYEQPKETSQDLLELADGRLIDRYSHPLITGDEIVGRFWAFRDITELKSAEQAIREQNRDLEERVLARTRAVEQVNNELIITNRELEQRRHEVEETHKKLLQLSSAVENSPSTIVITDLDGHIEYVNPKFTEITGYLYEEVLGKNPRILKLDGLTKERYEELWETILSGREWRGDFCNRKKNGESYREHASISPIRNAQGKITGFVAIKDDVTEQRRIAAELLAAQDAAHAANRSKSEFLANMSHEIRTPMNAIMGITYLLEQSNLPGDANVLIRKMGRAGRSLLAIINDILDFSKIEAGRVEIEHLPFRLSSVLDNLATIMSVNVGDKNIEVSITPPESRIDRLSGDALRLEQVLINLSGNAIKFTDQGHVEVSIQVVARSEQRITLRFAVSDTGMGIPPEKQGLIFESFSQVDASNTRRSGGTGLGLTISRQLVELMGGEMGLTSVLGTGSEFWFTLPFDLDQDALMSSPESECGREERKNYSPGEQLKGLRILVVDDCDINRDVALRIFSGKGARVFLANDGKQAVDWLQANPTTIDIVLMDVQMPVMDGYEATRLIRRMPELADLPVLALTAGVFKMQEESARAAGMTDFISKPFNVDAAVILINKYAGSGGAQNSGDDLSTVTVAVTREFPGLAIERGVAIWKDPEVYRQYLRKFARDYENCVQAMRDSDTGAAAALAHKLAGAAGTLALSEVTALAKEADCLLHAGEGTQGTLSRLQAALETVFDSIKVYASADSGAEVTPTETCDPDGLARLLTLAVEALDTDDMAEVRPILMTLSTMLSPVHLAPFANALENFDFRGGEEALRILAAEFNLSLVA